VGIPAAQLNVLSLVKEKDLCLDHNETYPHEEQADTHHRRRSVGA
jgi:hypothetical protein